MGSNNSKITFVPGGDTRLARRTTGGPVGGIAPSPFAELLTEVVFLTSKPRNRFERRSKAKRLKAFLKSAGDKP